MESKRTSELRIFTIGHSNHPIERFVELLRFHAIQVVVDVRSQPYFKYARQFNYEPLKSHLLNSDIRYLYLGRELGGRPEGDEFYDAEGHVLYSRVAASPLFREGVSRLERGVCEFTVALLCAEENPAGCPRRLLVSRVLLARGTQVEHIRGDGRVQTEKEVSAESDSAGGQMALYQKLEADSWKSISPVSPARRSRHETPSEPAST